LGKHISGYNKGEGFRPLMKKNGQNPWKRDSGWGAQGKNTRHIIFGNEKQTTFKKPENPSMGRTTRKKLLPAHEARWKRWEN